MAALIREPTGECRKSVDLRQEKGGALFLTARSSTWRILYRIGREKTAKNSGEFFSSSGS